MNKKITLLHGELENYKGLYAESVSKADNYRKDLVSLHTKMKEMKEKSSKIDYSTIYKIKRVDYETISSLLSKQLVEFKVYIDKLLLLRKKQVDTLIQFIKETIINEYPNSKVELYGSYATNLCLPHSDIDVVVDYNPQNENCVQFLGVIQSLFLKQKINGTTELIKSTMPVLRIVSNAQNSEIKIDITIKNSLHKGLECIDLVKGYVKKYPQIEVVILVIKNMLRISSLNTPYTGGISSYGLILLIVEYAQRYDNFSIIKSSDLLLSFLYFYGYSSFPFKVQPQPLIGTNVNNMVDPNNVPTVCDPLIIGNNVTKSTYNFVLIQVTK